MKALEGGQLQALGTLPYLAGPKSWSAHGDKENTPCFCWELTPDRQANSQQP
jgi:hypothetical protein